MLPGILKLIKIQNKIIAFLDSEKLRYFSYNTESRKLNVGTHNDDIYSTLNASLKDIEGFLIVENKSSYWLKTFKLNPNYKTIKRDFLLEKKLNCLLTTTK